MKIRLEFADKKTYVARSVDLGWNLPKTLKSSVSLLRKIPLADKRIGCLSDLNHHINLISTNLKFF